MGFSSNFISVIANLFNKQHAHIIDNGMLSEPFDMNRGVRQGDPLSPLLYVLAFEPFLQKLTNKIQGITIQNNSFRAAAYADDLTIGLGSNIDWTTFNEILALYEKASNAKVNKNKSILAPLTEKAKNTQLSGMENFKILKQNETVTILGYTVNNKGYAPNSLWSNTI